VLIIGSGGFIGSNLHNRLVEKGVDVIDNDIMNESKFLDVTDLDKLLSIDKVVETVIHLAAKISINNTLHNPYETYYTNCLGTLNLLEFARLKKIRKFINVSTYVYGQSQYLPIDERHPTNPHSAYHQSKLIAEQICQRYSNDFWIDIVTLRPFHIYGPGCKAHSFIPSVIRQIQENGKVLLSGEQTKRDFLFIDDFIDLVETILDKFPSGYNVYNVGYGRSYTLKEVSQFLANLLNKEITINSDNEMRPGDMVDVIADISKVSKAFNWKPHTYLEKGLELSINNSALL
jgi:UDP-glucose 4-epimerase